jgi:hypothetical protein
VVVGTPVLGGVVVAALGVVVVGVALGATVPGWAPLAGVVGVVEAAVEAGVEGGLVAAGAGVLAVVAACRWADAGIESPKARSVVPVVLAAKAAIGVASRQASTRLHIPQETTRPDNPQEAHARTRGRP